MENLQIDLNRLGAWAPENAIVLNTAKSKTVCFTEPLNYSLRDIVIPETSSYKFLGIISLSELSWADEVDYMVKKAWKALHCTMRILIKGNTIIESLDYTSLLRPILENWAACWDSYKKGQINALDRVQNMAAKFAPWTQRRQRARICALFKAYTGERVWKATGDRLKRPFYLSRVDHDRQIRSRKQKADVGKHSLYTGSSGSGSNCLLML
jgi:hypothetical protein